MTGDRIRDKIAASKRKGMWMGGVPPLGYHVDNRRLVPNEREAKVVRHIFRRFVELGSSTSLVKELRLDGVTSKSWTTQDGRVREGKPIDKSLVYKILNNRVYLGDIRHRDQWYPGEHPPIVERKLWDAVQAILAQNSRVRGNNTRARVPFLLKGIVVGIDGRALTPWFTRKKNGRIYRYYLPTRENKEHAGASGLPAGELEAAVLEQMRRVLRAPDMVAGVAERTARLDPSLDEAQVTVAMTRLDAIWDQLFPAEQQRIVRLLIDKTGQPEVIPASDGSLTVTVPIRIKRRGSRKAVALPDGSAVQPRPWDDIPTPIQLALARGHRWLAMVQSGEARTLSEVAEREGMDRAYVNRMVNLTTLAPDIVAAILDETLPPEVTLFDLASGTPLLWEEQRAIIGGCDCPQR